MEDGNENLLNEQMKKNEIINQKQSKITSLTKELNSLVEDSQNTKNILELGTHILMNELKDTKKKVKEKSKEIEKLEAKIEELQINISEVKSKYENEKKKDRERIKLF